MIVPFHFEPPKWPVAKLPIEKRQIIRAVDRTEDEILAYLSMETNLIGQGTICIPINNKYV